MGIELSKESFIKKNQKSTKYITIILIGMLILIVVFPSSNKNEKSLMSNDYKMDEVSYNNHEQDMVMYYENRLKDILEKTYWITRRSLFTNRLRLFLYKGAFYCIGQIYRKISLYRVVSSLHRLHWDASWCLRARRPS